jgi:arylsulfatase A-like enzyme
VIGARGATFRHHFTNWPLCCPSRATQLTGQYAHNHGVLGNKLPDGSYLRFPREQNLAVWLADAGYRVGHVGKFLNGYGPPEDLPETPFHDVTEVPPGWTDWRTGTAGTTYRYYRYTQNEWSGGPDDQRRGKLVRYRRRQVRHFKTDVTTADSRALIRRYARSADPFYLQVDYLAPHVGRPWTGMPHPPKNCGRWGKPAPRHAHALDQAPLAPRKSPAFNEADVSDKPPAVARLPRLDGKRIAALTGRYRCELESTLAIDEGVERIANALRRHGELANTYLVYTSDNGYLHGEHRVAGKKVVYEPAIRVPLMLRGPQVPAGVTVADLTSNADLATTVLGLSGAASPSPPDGLSLIPAARAPRRERGRELLIETDEYTAIRTSRYKLAEYPDGFVELYDLNRDPHELANAAADPAYAPVRGALADRLADLRDCAGADCALTPDVGISYRRLREGSRCLRGGLAVEATGGDEDDAVLLRVVARGRLVGADREAPFEVRVRRRQLRGKGKAGVRAQVSLLDGRRVAAFRAFALCR